VSSKRRTTSSKAPLAVALISYILASAAWAQNMGGPMMGGGLMSPPANQRPAGLINVGIEQRLSAQVPAELTFRDETGKPVRLGDYFGKRPLILNLVYYQCPMLCGEVLAGLTGAMKVVPFELGKDFDVLTVSFDPRETPAMATEKKAEFVRRYGRKGGDQGWHFLTGPAESINALTKAVGFQYQFDEHSQQFAHAAAIVVLTPGGKVSRYFYGVEFSPKDLRLGLVEASQNKIGSVVDQVLLYCYHYDPNTGKYGAIISNILRLAALATMLMVGTLLFVMFRHERTIGQAGGARVR
jgi:protein SCO1/2